MVTPSVDESSRKQRAARKLNVTIHFTNERYEF